MASGHVNRTYRPNTWLPPTSGADVQILLANSEPSTHGTFLANRDSGLQTPPSPTRRYPESGMAVELGGIARVL
jgi:hypothetical protein